MELFWKTSAGILISLVLILTLNRQEQDLGTVLSIAVCCMSGIAAIRMLEPVVDFLYEINYHISSDQDMMILLLQIVGIALVAEFISILCTDAGNASLGKSIHLLSSAVILYRSLPVMESMLDLILKIMGGL